MVAGKNTESCHPGFDLLRIRNHFAELGVVPLAKIPNSILKKLKEQQGFKMNLSPFSHINVKLLKIEDNYVKYESALARTVRSTKCVHALSLFATVTNVFFEEGNVNVHFMSHDVVVDLCVNTPVPLLLKVIFYVIIIIIIFRSS